MAGRFEAPWPGLGIGGSPALDYANTLDWRLRAAPTELLVRYEDLARWGRCAGFLTASRARALRAWAAGHPREGARALRRAVQVREAIATLFQSVARDDRLPAGALAVLERACREAERERALRPHGAGARWTWREGEPSPLRPALAAALDAARLLVLDDVRRVRQCGDAQCGWLFLDTSRNRSRRWCTMEGCGNRNKARRHHRRAAVAGGRDV
jgi:predicted RNA-binding Zn ribbon-like protein